MLHLLANIMPHTVMQFCTYSVLNIDAFSVFPIRMYLKTQILAQEENIPEPYEFIMHLTSLLANFP